MKKPVSMIAAMIRKAAELLMTAEEWLDINQEHKDSERKIPDNCTIKSCPHPAKNRDKRGKHWCIAHSDRGVWDE